MKERRKEKGREEEEEKEEERYENYILVWIIRLLDFWTFVWISMDEYGY